MALTNVDADGEAVVDQFYEPLYRFALSLARAEDRAADLTQETFFLWASRGHQLRDRSKVKSWLFTTLHREFLRARRHEVRFPSEGLDTAEADLPVVETDLGDGLDSELAMVALQQVDEAFRVPLALFYVEDFSYREIAEALELPIGTVMSRLSRGKAQLRRFLASRWVAAGEGESGADHRRSAESGEADAGRVDRIIPFGGRAAS